MNLKNTQDVPKEDMIRLLRFLKANEGKFGYTQNNGFYPEISNFRISPDKDGDPVLLFSDADDYSVNIEQDRILFFIDNLIPEPEDNLQEQILKLITPIVREQIRGGNG